MRVRYKHNREPQLYESMCLTTTPHEPPAAVTGPHSHCADCPYLGHGFVCGSGETCLRSKMARIMERDRGLP